MTTLDTLSATESDLRRRATTSVEELAGSAVRKLTEVQGDTGEAIHAAASSVRSTGRRSAAAIDDVATGTANHMDATASYIEHYDLRDEFTRLRRFAQRHPASSLLFAVAVGFLAGSALKQKARVRETVSEL